MNLRHIALIRLRLAVLSLACLLSFVEELWADFAITEVMSSASKTAGGTLVSAMPDFFEITNFGDAPKSLRGFSWRDGKGGVLNSIYIPDVVVLAPNESAIFVEMSATTMTNAQQFRDWWGESLPSTAQIILYDGSGAGLSAAGESVRLWKPGAFDDSGLVDEAKFGPALVGRTFGYDSGTGEFGIISTNGEHGAFKAATRDDFGSPGTNTGPVAARILTQPASATNCGQSQARFSVKAGGMPQPRFQWFANGLPLPGATTPTLIVTNPLEFTGMPMQVRVSNRLAVVMSDVVTLPILTNPAPPTFASVPADARVFEGDSPRFDFDVCAWPLATFQWSTNGVPIPGATNRSLNFSRVALSDSDMRVCLMARNVLGTNIACANLYVSRKPHLEITEVFAAGTSNCLGNGAIEDWFEITNFDDRAVDLRGYRVAQFAEDLLAGAVFSIADSLLLAPGCSAIFVRQAGTNNVIDGFRNWWNPDALPPGLLISTFFGFGLNSDHDTLFLWTPSETNVGGQPLHSIQYSEFQAGLSKWFADDVWPVENSVVGERGAYASRFCGEIASPGYVANPPPRFASSGLVESSILLHWRAVPGRSYQIDAAADVLGPWNPAASVRVAADAVEEGSFAFSPEGNRFFRVREVSQ